MVTKCSTHDQIDDFRGAFRSLQGRRRSAIFGQGEKVRAPFCAAGEDCFEDVDHRKVANDVKALALEVTKYMKDRMREEEMWKNFKPEKMLSAPYVRHTSFAAIGFALSEKRPFTI